MESFQGKKFHFIGIGGIGTSGLAKMLLKHGAVVSGSDMADSAVLQEMASMGIRICLGHSPENIPPDADAVVISAAIPAGNPELARAGELGIRIYKYAEMLGKLFGEYQGIAVAGTHGKSTTSAWIAYLLEKAGRSPTFLIGAHVPQMGGSSGIGDGPFFVAEACEYDRSFLNLRPLIGVILNIEQDHLDYYRDEEEIVDAFTDFAGGIRPGGVLIANGQDRNTLRLLRRLNGQVQVRTFGRSDSCDLSAGRLYLREGFYEFELCERGAVLGLARLSIPGIHNVDNALAVVSACLAAGLSVETILEHLGGFTGIDRRLMLKGQLGGVVVLDDYAHHPTEVGVTIDTARKRFPDHKLVAVFKPHRASRVKYFAEDFKKQLM
ncbi:MAG TPA: UDP-N-acetylmuramate--L-alanine ligase, partial [Anaerohalosphaeraceae bacterium]|nr:UDP-N-acetylmuramate--L-alanine ligase [Anaerohalosphaeraceae bacterium]